MESLSLPMGLIHLHIETRIVLGLPGRILSLEVKGAGL